MASLFVAPSHLSVPSRPPRELAHANAELRRSDQALDEFAYITSHDLREPLRGLHKYAAFLLEDYRDLLDDAGRATLEALARLTQCMEAFRNALLYYARGGRVDLAFAETDLGKIVDEVLDSLTPPWREAGVEVRSPRRYRPCAAVPPASAKSSATSSPML